MKMVYLFFVLLCAGLVLKFQTGGATRSKVFAAGKSGETILLNDRKALERNLKKETLNDQNWVRINDFSLPVKDLVNLNNSKDIFRLSNGSVNDLSGCLKKNFCGMERRDDNDSYFDESRTPAHILLGRNLEVMLEALKQNNELKNEVDWDVIRELTDSANEKIQVLAVMLLRDFNTKDATTEKLFKTADHYKGNAKALAYIELSSKNTQDEHALLISSIEKSFSSDDANTVISIVEKLGRMHLTKNEMEKVSSYLCHYKEQGSEDHNWKMIKYQMGKYGIEMDAICV